MATERRKVPFPTIQQKGGELNQNSQPTVWTALAQALIGAMTHATTGEELIRRSTPDADGLLPSDHFMEAIKETLSRVPGVTLYEVEA